MASKKIPEKIGQYAVVDRIGQGSMGEVFLCRDPSLDRAVVVKRMQVALRGHEDMVERFSREVQVLSAMNHPNVVQVYGYWAERGTLCLSMEYVNGYTLRQILDKAPRPPAWASCAFLRPLLDALVLLHRGGIVHRDLKPSNIMLNYWGHPKLLDFGVVRVESREIQELTMPGTVIGTTAYMSPEQTFGQKATAQSDLFAFGIIAFEMLSGKHPFRGATAEETADSIVKKQLSPQDLPGDLSLPLRKWVCGLLQKDPARRPANAWDALVALDAAIEGLPRELAYPLSQWQRSIRKDIPFVLTPEWKHPVPPVLYLGICALAGFVAGALCAIVL